ncbi:hypothetical protein Micbo1qcDRAFT_50880 [Microdochium bolleyi]|uniref:Uncharacterized protein n=1 Tax=Microdochium bolleyi TaxID=196109 RepID=A0A136J6E5_9PEZI|nr:hypothetical protein Micbo1qcDRAFT_50880 [Microdochium bolleyi]
MWPGIYSCRKVAGDSMSLLPGNPRHGSCSSCKVCTRKMRQCVPKRRCAYMNIAWKPLYPPTWTHGAHLAEHPCPVIRRPRSTPGMPKQTNSPETPHP